MPTPTPSLGAAIRRRRAAQGMSLRAVAGAAAVSPSFMSQLENDLTRPSIGTLHRIALALDTTAQALLGGSLVDAPEGAVTITRAGATEAVQHDDDPADGIVRPISTPTGSRVHAMEIVGAPPDFAEPYAHAGQEFLYVIDGPVEVQIGDATHRLDSGDSIAYPGSTPHQTRRLAAGSRIIIVTVDD